VMVHDAISGRSTSNVLGSQWDDEALTSIRGQGGPSSKAPACAVSVAVDDIWFSVDLSTAEAPKRSMLGMELMLVHVVQCVRSPLSAATVHADLQCLSVHRLHELQLDFPPSLGRCSDNRKKAKGHTWVDRGVRSDVLLRILRGKICEPEEQHGEWSVKVTEPVVVIPMPHSISIHGRREGRAGRWEEQRVRKEGPVPWTNLGTLVNDGTLMMKAFLVFVKERVKASGQRAGMAQHASAHRKDAAEALGQHKPSTEFPEGLPPVHISVDGFQVRFEDDPFEVWVGAVFRLHQHEADQRRGREHILETKLQHLRREREDPARKGGSSWRSSGGGLGEQELREVRAEMTEQLQRYDATVWKKRVNKLRCDECLVHAAPLLRLHVKTIDGVFLPRSARHLQGRMAEVDLQTGGGADTNGMANAAVALPTPKFDTMIGGELQQLVVTDFSVRIRDYPDPMLAVQDMLVTSFEDGLKEHFSCESHAPRVSHGLEILCRAVILRVGWCDAADKPVRTPVSHTIAESRNPSGREPLALLFATEEVAPPSLIRTVHRKIHRRCASHPGVSVFCVQLARHTMHVPILCPPGPSSSPHHHHLIRLIHRCGLSLSAMQRPAGSDAAVAVSDEDLVPSRPADDFSGHALRPVPRAGHLHHLPRGRRTVACEPGPQPHAAIVG
jgi:hypothetical protein